MPKASDEFAINQLAQEMNLTDVNLTRRLNALGFHYTDLGRVSILRPIINQNAEELTSIFFNYLGNYTEAHAMLSNKTLMDQARTLKLRHLQAMANGIYDREYAVERLKLAFIYAECGLDTQVFLGAFHNLLKNLGTILMKEFSESPIEAFENFMSLKKIAFLDIGIIIDAMIHRRESLIRSKQNELDRTENDLRKSKILELRLRAAVDKSASIISMRDARGNLLYASQAVEKIFGFSLVDSNNFSFDKIIHEDDRHLIADAYASVSPGQCSRVPRIRARTKDGRWIWLEGILCNFLDDKDVGAIFAIFDEVTDRVKIEESLEHSIKMESFGKLAAGIAHDFNNLTMIINAYGEEIYRLHQDDEGIKKMVEPIVHAAQRASTLTRQLLAFSRKQVMQPQQVNLNDVLESSGKMLKRVLGEDIDVETIPGSKLDSVYIDPTQLEQVIMNLAVNSRDAMPKGGKLTLSTSNVYLDEDYIRGHGDGKPGPHVMLAVTDNGMGIDFSTQSKIFDPFFTTKGIGKGTGLGLSMVQGIVKQSGGNIWVYSEVGMGTTFKIYFPRSRDFNVSSQGKAPQTIKRGSETVLLIDDEKSIRDALKMMLINGGYNVLEFSDPNQLLDACRTSEAKIHLLLTDVVMPDTDGLKLAEQVSQIIPEIKVIYMSGYTDDAVARHGKLSPGASFIEKPIGRDELLGKIRYFLDIRGEQGH
jgi:two-component system cell cycle sensor histidine kinase/response regulator CckA